jgi:hypothetical protein
MCLCMQPGTMHDVPNAQCHTVAHAQLAGAFEGSVMNFVAPVLHRRMSCHVTHGPGPVGSGGWPRRVGCRMCVESREQTALAFGVHVQGPGRSACRHTAG